MQEAVALRVGLLGFGTVGSSFAEVLAATGADVRITRIFNRDVERKKSHERAKFVGAEVKWTSDATEVVTAEDVDVVVEVIGGLEPIEGWLTTAIHAGKHIVTANKQLIAYRGATLLALAAEKKVHLLYNAAVAGGVPVIPGITQGLSGDKITRISGILNGTCNFILSAMEKGAEYADVLKTAQSLGYAEANPSADVDGFDARAKLCVLSRLALRAELNPDEVPAQTISTVAAIDFAYAKELGCTLRQVSRAEVAGGKVHARVGPMLVPKEMPIAWSHDTQNMVVTSGEFGGDVVFSGHGAGGHPTAVAVTSDVLRIAAGAAAVRFPATASSVDGDVTAPHYIRFVVADQPGIVAAIAGALAKYNVNIDSLLQHRGYAAEKLPFVVTTEPCLRSTLERAVAEIAALEYMLEAPLVLQILTSDDHATD
ncbi:homoserine dehydrogenase [Granulicella cerasi]|uniref:Homoserine dehydrogenase n=1 Tax=Granulicella cerasi TaxID=741063 RepID=A0ABW1Z8Z3_9BACT|nr:homoserine dehydrogenase [Granulicella cerasi]